MAKKRIKILPLISLAARRRFWRKVFILDKDSCWYWEGARNTTSGHGWFKVEGKKIYAHRFSFVSVNGFEPDVVRHTCDEPACVNPKHLIKGTQKENVRDAIERNRHVIMRKRAAAEELHDDMF